MTTYLYTTNFKLTAPVNNLEEAQQYLIVDDMTKYLKEDTRISIEIRDAVEQIQWLLVDKISGHIDLITDRLLNNDELKIISNFVQSENSDGLGEGFSQQNFANYTDEGLIGYEGSNWDDEYIIASFDWNTNDYIFTLKSN